jgi:hypothetical protein
MTLTKKQREFIIFLDKYVRSTLQNGGEVELIL